MPKTKRLICLIHDEINDLATALEYDVESLEVLKRHKSSILKKLRKIQKLSEEAKESGQKMEDRMSEYRASIEAIGFTRDKS